MTLSSDITHEIHSFMGIIYVAFSCFCDKHAEEMCDSARYFRG
jgi:hypothetical protein